MKILEMLHQAMMQDVFIPKAPMLVVDDVESFKWWKSNWKIVPTWLGVDTETIGLDAYSTYTTVSNIEIDHAVTVLQYFDGHTNYVINIPKMYQKGLQAELFDFIRPIHESNDVQKVFYNATFDIKMLWQAGVFTENAVCLMLGAKLCEPTASGLYPSLKGVTSNWLNYDMDKGVRATFLNDDVKLGILTEEQLKYAGDDVEVLAPLYRMVYHKLAATGELDGWAVSNFALQGTAYFELGGVPVDYEELRQLDELDNKEYDDLLSRKAELGLSPYNLNSGPQVKDIFKNVLGIELSDTQKDTLKYYAEGNGISGAKQEIAKYIYDVRTHSKKAEEKIEKTFLAPMHKNKSIPRNYDYAYSSVDYLYNISNRRALRNQFGELPTKTSLNKFKKQLAKTFYECWISKGGVWEDNAEVIRDYYLSGKYNNFITHEIPDMDYENNMFLWRTNLNQDKAVTGRYSSTGGLRLANLQNILGNLRSATRAPKGWVVCGADYSAIEVLIAAQLAKESGIIKTINSGLDVHKYSASMMFEVDYDDVTPKQRKIVKAIVFLVLYGGTVFSLAESLGVDIKKAQELYDKYFSTFPGFKVFVDNRVSEARFTGNVRFTSGSYRPLFVNEKSYAYSLRKSIERASKNAAMQGACAVIIKRASGLAARRIHELGWIHKVIGITPVHDELGMIAPKHMAEEVSKVLAEVMDEAAKEALPDINKPVVVDTARHWAKESYEKTLLGFVNGDVNESNTEENISMCFGKHTAEYIFWDINRDNPNKIKEFLSTYDKVNYEEGSLEHKLKGKLI